VNWRKTRIKRNTAKLVISIPIKIERSVMGFKVDTPGKDRKKVVG
jgi:hypothetical protein